MFLEYQSTRIWLLRDSFRGHGHRSKGLEGKIEVTMEKAWCRDKRRRASLRSLIYQ